MKLQNPKQPSARRFAAFEPSDFGLKVGCVVLNAPRSGSAFEKWVDLSLSRGTSRLVEDNQPYLGHRPASPKAFTLIEVLLAMAICAIVLVAINAVFATAVRLRDRTSSAVDEALPVERTLDRLRRDLKGTVGPRGFLAGDFKCGAQAMGSTMGLSGEAGGAGLDFFTSTGRMGDNTPWGDLQEVLYELKAPTDRDQAGMDLVRCVNRNLLATTTPTPDIQPLLSHVETVQFDCYDGTQWRTTWDTSAGDTNLPTAVRVRIQLVAKNGEDLSKQAPIELLVPLETVTRTNR
jgi:type II secretion system protein J